MIDTSGFQSRGCLAANLGFPRSCSSPQWYSLVHRYQNGAATEQQFLNEVCKQQNQQLELQSKAGLDYITIGNSGILDQVLQQSVAFGLIPEPVRKLPAFSMQYAAMITASGRKDYKTWFSTSHSYISPVWEQGCMPALQHNYWLSAIQLAPEQLKSKLRPAIIGPYTFASLLQSESSKQATLANLLQALIPIYAQILHALAGTPVQWVQLDEPSLTFADGDQFPVIQDAYETLSYTVQQLHHNDDVSPLRLMVQTYYGAVRSPEQLFQLPADGFGLDLVRDHGINLHALRQFPAHKWLGAGVIDSSRPWRSDLRQIWHLVEQIRESVQPEYLMLQPAGSLADLPATSRTDTQSPPLVRITQAGAYEKLLELNTLASGVKYGKRSIRLDLEDSDIMRQALLASGRNS